MLNVYIYIYIYIYTTLRKDSRELVHEVNIDFHQRLKNSWQNLCFTMTISKLEIGIYYTKDGLKGVFAVFFTCCMKMELFFNF